MSTIALPERGTLHATPTHMHAAAVESFDRPLRYAEVEVPVPGPGEVLVHALWPSVAASRIRPAVALRMTD